MIYNLVKCLYVKLDFHKQEEKVLVNIFDTTFEPITSMLND